VKLCLSVVLVIVPSLASAEDMAKRGSVVFQEWCAPCHAAVSGTDRLAGTSTLEQIYKGSKPAALEQRTDLTPAFVSAIVRHGINAMPAFRKTEISDSDVAAVSAYLARYNPHK
jgi:(+)-pinoresinol hydroxylase